MTINTADSDVNATDNASTAKKSWAERFVAEYDEARMVKAAAKRRRREKDRARNSGKVIDREILDRIKGRQACIHSRLDEGYKWWGGYVAGAWQKAFVFEGLMSDRHPILLKFVQKLHRASSLLTGMDKAIMEGCDSKLLALDSPYTGFNGKMRGIIRIDLDIIFESYGDLLDAIEAANVPLPNIVVGHVTDAGQIVRPHLYWILNKSVCWTDNGRGGPVRYFQAVHRGLTHALLAAGADPGGLSNPIRGKNPLSPHWQHFVGHGEPYDLGDLAQFVDMDVSTEDLYRESAALAAPDGVQTASGPVHSNEFFHALQVEAFAAVERFKAADAEAEFAAHLSLKAFEISSTRRRDEAHAKAIAARVASYVWSHYDPSKRQQARPGRGKLWHECDGKTIAERQAMGGMDVAERRRESTLERLVAASRTVSDDIWSIGQADLAKAAGMSLTTVKRHWRAVVLARLESASRCIAKKRPTSASGTRTRSAALSSCLAHPTRHRQSRRTTHAPGFCRAEGRTGATIQKLHIFHRAADGGAGVPQVRRGGAARHEHPTVNVRAPEPSEGQHPPMVPPM